MLRAVSYTHLEDTGSGENGFTFFYMGDSQADPDVGSYEEWGKLYQKAAADGSPAVSYTHLPFLF